MSSLADQNFVFNGLGTLSTTVVTAGLYFVKGKVTDFPSLVNGGGASSLVVTVNQNGSPKYTGSAGASGFYTNLSCAANDVIAVVFSSSASADSALNVIKSSVSIGLGE